MASYRRSNKAEVPVLPASAPVAAWRWRQVRDRLGLNAPFPFVLPLHLLGGAVILVPSVYVVWLSFYDSSFGQSPVYVGFGNYAQVLSDPYFWHALLNTVVVVTVVVHVELLAGLAMALLFNSGIPWTRFMLAAVIAPYAVSEVGVVVMWRFMVDPEIGPISQMMTAIGLAPIQWSIDPWQALGIVAAMTIWINLPFTFIILYAARLGLPPEIYEAAAIDSATGWQMFRHITLPLLKPAILIALMFRYIFAFRLFVGVWLLTNGGPARSTEVIAIYLYQEAFRYNEFGIASATGWLMVVMALVLTSFYLWRMYREAAVHA